MDSTSERKGFPSSAWPFQVLNKSDFPCAYADLVQPYNSTIRFTQEDPIAFGTKVRVGNRDRVPIPEYDGWILDLSYLG